MPSHAQPINWTLVRGLAAGWVWSLTACAPSEPASIPTPARTAPALSTPALVLPPATGGWSQAEFNADDVQEAARFAVQAFAVAQHSRTLYKDVVEAQRQVVSGVNFKLKLQVLHLGTPRTAQATVWRQLHGAYQLSDWVWVD